MTIKKITELTALSSAASDDLLYLLDVSDTSGSSDGTSKKITASNLRNFIDKHYEVSFTSQTSVRVTHNLNKRPSVIVVDSGGNVFEPACNYESGGDPLNIVDVSWNVATTGKIVCN